MDSQPTSAEPPSTPPRRKRLTRDQRRDILLMRRLGYSYEYIANFLKVSQRAVQYTCQKQQATPQHSKAGRPPRPSKEEGDRLGEVVTATVCERSQDGKTFATTEPENGQ
jgi:hypothetical protein